MVDQLRARGIADERVLAAFLAVPREAFVDASQQDDAYADMPLPIGSGQTISQPLVVAMTVQALALRGDERVLDVGTGSGYAAAILAKLARRVDTIERLAVLAESARARLAAYANVEVHVGDGSLGLPDARAVRRDRRRRARRRAPPQPLLGQLAVGGRLVLPIGSAFDQSLFCITRTPDGYDRRDLGDVRFVPLVGAEGWPHA